jgi:hypothetical protein
LTNLKPIIDLSPHATAIRLIAHGANASSDGEWNISSSPQDSGSQRIVDLVLANRANLDLVNEDVFETVLDNWSI